MSNLEKFSVDKELEKLEKQRISSGVVAAYPELWGPIEKKKKEEILESARQEINKALQEKDFAYADELIQSLRNHFEEDVIKERVASKEYVAQTSNETKTTLEVQKLFKDVDWRKAKESLQRYSDLPAYQLSMASEMRKFDPQRFDKEIEISDSQWKRFVGMTEKERGYSVSFLGFASSLKELDPKRFKEDIKIDEKYWNEIAKAIEEERNYPKWFLYLYEMAYTIDPQEIRKRVPIDKKYWEKIRKEIDYVSDCSECVVTIAGIAQKVKPEELPDITISPKQWNEAKDNLQDMLKYGASGRKVFSYANALKNVKVK